MYSRNSCYAGGRYTECFTSIHVHLTISGNELKDSHVKRAVELSAGKYCSASIMLSRGGVEISHDYEIIEAMV